MFLQSFRCLLEHLFVDDEVRVVEGELQLLDGVDSRLPQTIVLLQNVLV